MPKITYPNKSVGDKFTADEATEIKTSVNALYDEVEGTLQGPQGDPGPAGPQGDPGSSRFEVITDATVSRTLILTDYQKYIRFTNDSPVTVTIPLQSAVAWEDDTEIILEQAGDGVVTVVGTGGIDLFSTYATSSLKKYATITLKRIAEDQWVLSGQTLIEGLVDNIWQVVPDSDYTATPASASRITMSNTDGLRVGLPIRYVYDGVTHWAVIEDISTDAYIDIAGSALSVADDITQLAVGPASNVVHMGVFVGGEYGDGTGDLLLADMNTYLRWKLGRAYLVQFEFTHATADTTGNPKVNVRVGGDLVGTDDSNNGVELGVAGTWVSSGLIAINQTNYLINRNEAIEVACTVAGTAGDAADLSGNLVFVLE